MRITGVNLLGFAALLVWLASREVIKPSLAMAVVVADLLWVAGSAALLPAGVFSTTGNWLVAGIADVVLLFAILQYVGIRRMRAVAQVGPTLGAGSFRIEWATSLGRRWGSLLCRCGLRRARRGER